MYTKKIYKNRHIRDPEITFRGQCTSGAVRYRCTSRLVFPISMYLLLIWFSPFFYFIYLFFTHVPSGAPYNALLDLLLRLNTKLLRMLHGFCLSAYINYFHLLRGPVVNRSMIYWLNAKLWWKGQRSQASKSCPEYACLFPPETFGLALSLLQILLVYILQIPR